MSFVFGEKDVDYLKKRHQTLLKSPLFQGMEYSDDHKKLAEWIPLVMQKRMSSDKLAATKMDLGNRYRFWKIDI